jgi:hypothetical protein
VEGKSTIRILSASSVGSRHVRLNYGSGLLASELASLSRCLLLGGGLPSMGLCLMPTLISMTLLMVESSSWPEQPEHSPSMVWL